MAARTRKPFHDERTRLKIKTSQIINRLSDHILGKVDMKPSQVTAGLGLLKKTVPDLQATEITGKDGGPVQVTIAGADSGLL
jgi:hypothetical protein